MVVVRYWRRHRRKTDYEYLLVVSRAGHPHPWAIDVRVPADNSFRYLNGTQHLVRLFFRAMGETVVTIKADLFMYKSVKACAILFLLGQIQPLWAMDGAQQLNLFLKDLTTLQADFEQTLEQPDDDQVYTSNGVFYLKRPGQLRWEYKSPSEQLIVADGDRIWLYDIELEQVSHRSQQAALVGTPAQLLSEEAPISEHFEIHDLGKSDGLNWVELLPKAKESQFSSLRLGLDDAKLLRMEMIDNFAQTTRFVFDNVQRNPALDEALFNFEPPPMIDLIGDL